MNGQFLLLGGVEIKRTIRRLRFWASGDVAPLVKKECTVSPWNITFVERDQFVPCDDGNILLHAFSELLPRFTHVGKLNFDVVKFKQLSVDAIVFLPNLT
ncbi:hypothetical protein MSAN_01238400 [Mycena sanguinolenta]|uniref:Uncharacterized protein n=1 Tax=Mycena sanguinolenta TaxID=230812 RepID=A0A8H6YDB0_9AGAR|nr:hypothetical protein MSAN_01238400 [Mycena sanguinolenta]